MKVVSFRSYNDSFKPMENDSKLELPQLQLLPLASFVKKYIPHSTPYALRESRCMSLKCIESLKRMLAYIFIFVKNSEREATCQSSEREKQPFLKDHLGGFYSICKTWSVSQMKGKKKLVRSS